jgi:hypothetical protein
MRTTDLVLEALERVRPNASRDVGAVAAGIAFPANVGRHDAGARGSLPSMRRTE